MKVTGIAGSLRETSTNRGLLRAFADHKPEGVEMELVDIGALPLFNSDIEDPLPEGVETLKQAIDSSEAVIITTPEYNRSVSGVLKNAIDWASRPYGQNSFKDKLVLVASASPGSAGGAMATYHLKQSLLHLSAKVMGQPEFWVGGSDKFDDAGNLVDEKTFEFIQSAWEQITRTAQ